YVARDQMRSHRFSAAPRQVQVVAVRAGGVCVPHHVDQAVWVLLQTRRHFVDSGAEAAADRRRIEGEGHVRQIAENSGAIWRLGDVDASAGRTFVEFPDLLVELVAHRAAGHTAKAGADDPRGLATDQAAQEVAKPGPADTADRGPRYVALARVRIGDTRGQAEQRHRC